MIKKRNLDPSLIQWIMTQTGLGPGVGEIFYVAADSSATSQYRTQLESMGVDSGSIYTLPSLAYAATVPYRNDVILITPGTYTETEKITWANAQTHMIGIGNPTWRQGGKIRIQTTTEDVDAVIDVTGTGVHFQGFNITQNGAFAANVTALRLSSTYFSASQLDLRGHLQSAVAGIEGASSLEFAHGSSLGFGSTFKDCNFGTGSGATRTASGATTNGVIYFATASQNGSPAAYTEFHNCRVLSRAETAATSMVKFVTGSFSTDRYVLWNDCLFYNFWMNKNGTLESCFYFDSTTAGSPYQILTKSTLVGVDEWVDQDSGHVLSDMPVTGTGGGLTREAVGTVGN